MAEMRNSQTGSQKDGSNVHKCETICVDCNRILDSCRDKDCFEDVKVYLTDCSQEIVDRATNIRDKYAKVVGAYLDVEPVPFNRGFYQIFMRIFVKIVAEACINSGRLADIEGIAVCEKKVILYGSEGEVSIFKSDPENSNSCVIPSANNMYTNLPVAVCEVVDPLVLKTKVADKNAKCMCCCSVEDIPENICMCLNGNLITHSESERNLYVTLGLFSVIRIERPGQFLINAAEYHVPEKECVATDGDDPCALFRQMEFPVEEFSSPSYRQIAENSINCKKC